MTRDLKVLNENNKRVTARVYDEALLLNDEALKVFRDSDMVIYATIHPDFPNILTGIYVADNHSTHEVISVSWNDLDEYIIDWNKEMEVE